VALRFVHVVAAALWVGGGISYLALRTAPVGTSMVDNTSRLLGHTFSRLFKTGFFVFAVTGVILALARLADQSIDTSYALVLGIKALVTLAMFSLAIPRRTNIDQKNNQFHIWRSRVGWIVALGLVAYGLSLVMNEMAEIAFKNLR
jgi:putative copper export protein